MFAFFFLTRSVPAFIALAVTVGVMFVLAVGIEKLVLRPLVNQPDIILFMATFGLTYFLIGLGELVFGGEPKVMIANELLSAQGVGGVEDAGRLRVVAEDRHRGRGDRVDHGGGAGGVLPEDPHRACAARCR